MRKKRWVRKKKVGNKMGVGETTVAMLKWQILYTY